MSAESFDEAKSDRDNRAWAELAEAACEGNREARNELYMLARPAIHGLGWRARRYLRNASYGYTEPPVTPEDIDQQAFIVFCELLESWPQGDEEFRAYMHRKMPGRLMHYVRASLE